MKIVKLLLLPLLLFSFAFLFMATSKVLPCEGDCATVQDVYMALRNGRESYVNYVYRCGYNQVSDTLCIFVKDTTGINWNSLADTACMEASRRGLTRQKIFVIKDLSSPIDTLARIICP